MAKRPVICLTPTKNEAHNLPRFLACASLWADKIVVADQGSTDGSREIIAGCSKAVLVDNPSPVFNEPERQKLLIDAARKIAGDAIFVTLDADEIFTAEILTSPRWQELQAARPGTVGWFYRANIWDGFAKAWMEGHRFPWAYVDDGAPHVGTKIHSPRIPVPEGAPAIEFLSDLPVMHYAYVDWDRIEARNRWYACWEVIEKLQLRPAKLYRRYHDMYNVSDDQLMPLPQAWIAGYEAAGIPMKTFIHVPPDQWYRDIAGWMETYGPEKFRKLAVWEEDWDKRYEQYFGKKPSRPLKDPRTSFEKNVHKWLARTQPQYMSIHVRVVERMLRVAGW